MTKQRTREKETKAATMKRNKSNAPTTLALRNNSNGSRATRTRAHRLARWQAVFLKTLREAPNVAHACRKAGVNRTTAYRHKEDDEEFNAKWEDALNASVDRCEEKVSTWPGRATANCCNSS